jgi:hypothetical protein
MGANLICIHYFHIRENVTQLPLIIFDPEEYLSQNMLYT